MTKQALTIENFTAAMEQAVQERGADWVYPLSDTPSCDAKLLEESPYYRGKRQTCLYFTDEAEPKPACIIGAALANLGWKADDLPTDSMSAGELFNEVGIIDSLLSPEEQITLSLAADAAQATQDAGADWGEALGDFHRFLRRG